MKPSSIDVWLSRGKPVELGGRELILVPLPLARLRDVQATIEEKVYQKTHEMVEDQEKNPDPMRFIVDVLKSLDFVDICYRVLADPIRPDNGQPVNPDLTKKFVEDYLDTPTLRRMVLTFVEVNELEEIVKGFQTLPGVKKLMEVLMTTFGMTFLSSFLKSSISPTGRLPNLPIPSSKDILPRGTSEESLLRQKEKETVQ